MEGLDHPWESQDGKDGKPKDASARAANSQRSIGEPVCNPAAVIRRDWSC